MEERWKTKITTDVFEDITQNIKDKEIENVKEKLNSLKDRLKSLTCLTGIWNKFQKKLRGYKLHILE